MAWLCGVHPIFLEHLQVVRYRPGQFFRTHTDHIPSKKAVSENGQRSKTLFVYLSQATAGTRFPYLDISSDVPFTHLHNRDRKQHLSKRFLPKQNDGLLWSNVRANG